MAANYASVCPLSSHSKLQSLRQPNMQFAQAHRAICQVQMDLAFPNDSRGPFPRGQCDMKVRG